MTLWEWSTMTVAALLTSLALGAVTTYAKRRICASRDEATAQVVRALAASPLLTDDSRTAFLCIADILDAVRGGPMGFIAVQPRDSEAPSDE